MQVAFPRLFDRLDDRGDGKFRSFQTNRTPFLIQLLDMLLAASVFPGNADAQIKEVEKWLKDKGVRDFEPVALAVSQMSKVKSGSVHRQRAVD